MTTKSLWSSLHEPAKQKEFYREFYRGGNFVVASNSYLSDFKAGKWWAV